MSFTVLKSFLDKFRTPKGVLYFPSDIEVKNNVFVTARERGKIVGYSESHNILTNAGRNWLRGLCAVASFPDTIPNATPATPLNVNPYDPTTNVHTDSKYRVRYAAFGVGGAMQTQTPPGGSFTEVVTRTGLQTPVEYRVNAGNTFYYSQVQGQDLTDLSYAPTAYSIRFRRIVAETDISYASQPTYGTKVPLSEVALFTSKSDSQIMTSPVEGSVGMIPCVAYNTFSTVYKTPLIQVELIWEWRF